uniref:Uncharacterized protein n=1 Tax=Oryza meridionalis TaxID=40149 RepID=A0A0E0D5N5_9ORYZ
MAMLLLVSAASQFHPLHARPVATPGSHLMPSSSHDDDANATAVCVFVNIGTQYV